MFIYFLEQVWAYDQIIANETQLIQLHFWDLWRDKLYRKRKNVYPFPWMEEGNDYIDY